MRRFILAFVWIALLGFTAVPGHAQSWGFPGGISGGGSFYGRGSVSGGTLVNMHRSVYKVDAVTTASPKMFPGPKIHKDKGKSQ